MAAREIRESNPPEGVIESAKEAAEILHSIDLDARALDEGAKIDSGKAVGRGLAGALLMLATAPIVLLSSGLQALAGWYQGDN